MPVSGSPRPDETEKQTSELSRPGRFRTPVAIVVAIVTVGWAAWSWSTGGVIAVLVDGAAAADSAAQLAALREALSRWGALAPAVYVAAVVVEVLVAPIPGTLLYAPAGALFGGFWGGVLSLIGNTLGAMAAATIAGALGEARIASRLAGSPVERHVDAIRQRAFWVVMLLRLNPLTSSDLVSYAAGAIGVRVWTVGLATFIGMAPLCFAQAYLAEQIFAILPGGFYLLLVAGVIYVSVLIAWLWRR